jgi:flagellar biosynthesis protein FliQ
MSEDIAGYLSFFGILITIVRPAIVVTLLAGLWVALSRARLPARERVITWVAAAIALVLWLAIVWTVAANGVFDPGHSKIPLVPFAVILPPVIGLAVLMRSDRIASALDATSPSWLVGIQVYRILGGNFLVLWAYGAIPGQFALPAGIGDVLVGVLALPAAIYLSSGRPHGRRIAVAWNILGAVDLVTAVTLGTLTTPGPLHRLALEHPNFLTTTYPTVMTPVFAVPLSLILHGLSLWQLSRRRSTEAGAAGGISKHAALAHR